MKSLCNTSVSLLNPVKASALLAKLQAEEIDGWTYYLVDDPDTAYAQLGWMSIPSIAPRPAQKP